MPYVNILLSKTLITHQKRWVIGLFAVIFTLIFIVIFLLYSFLLSKDTTSQFAPSGTTAIIHVSLNSKILNQQTYWLNSLKPLTENSVTFYDLLPYIDNEFSWFFSDLNHQSLLLKSNKLPPEKFLNSFGLEIQQIDDNYYFLVVAGSHEIPNKNPLIVNKNFFDNFRQTINPIRFFGEFLALTENEMTVFPIELQENDLIFRLPIVNLKEVPENIISKKTALAFSLPKTETNKNIWNETIHKLLPKDFVDLEQPDGISYFIDNEKIHPLIWWNNNSMDVEKNLISLSALHNPTTIQKNTPNGDKYTEIRADGENIQIIKTSSDNETFWKTTTKGQEVPLFFASSKKDLTKISDSYFGNSSKNTEHSAGFISCPLLQQTLQQSLFYPPNLLNHLLNICSDIYLKPSEKYTKLIIKKR